MTTHYRGVETIHHPGGGLGSNAQMLKVPAADLDVVVLVNRQDVYSTLLVNAILDCCLPGLQPFEERQTSAVVTGTFRSPRTGRIVQLFPHPGGGQVCSIDGADVHVAPDSAGVLRSTPMFSHFKMAVELLPKSIRLLDYGNVDELLALEPVARPDASRIAGRYRSDTTGTEVHIAGALMRTMGRFGASEHELQCLAEGVWRSTNVNKMMAPPSGFVSFPADYDGFEFTNMLTRALKFRRVA